MIDVLNMRAKFKTWSFFFSFAWQGFVLLTYANLEILCHKLGFISYTVRSTCSGTKDL